MTAERTLKAFNGVVGMNANFNGESSVRREVFLR